MTIFTIYYDCFKTTLEIDPEDREIWELQNMVLQKLGFTTENIICLLHERGILGKDIPFIEPLYKLCAEPVIYVIVNYFASTQENIFEQTIEDFIDLQEENLSDSDIITENTRDMMQNLIRSTTIPTTVLPTVTTTIPSSTTSQRNSSYLGVANFDIYFNDGETGIHSFDSLINQFLGSLENVLGSANQLNSVINNSFNDESTPETIDSEIIDSLPISKFKESEVVCDSCLTCRICLDDFIEDVEIRQLPCKHNFHKDCIDIWLKNYGSMCPLCQTDLRK